MEVLKNGFLENYLRMKFLKLNLKIRILENYLKMEVLKIGILKTYSRMKFL